MSALELAAHGTATVTARTAHGPWRRPIVLPPQFAAAAGNGALVFAAHPPPVGYAAAGGLLVAFVALIAVLLADQWIARRASSAMRRTDFDRDFRAYAEAVGARRSRPPSAI